MRDKWRWLTIAWTVTFAALMVLIIIDEIRNDAWGSLVTVLIGGVFFAGQKLLRVMRGRETNVVEYKS